MLYRISAIAVGGALGTVLRFLVTHWVHQSPLANPSRLFGKAFPWGTLVVNLSGCLLVGLVTGLFHRRLAFNADLRALLLVGLFGGYTTFSTFALDTVELLRGGDMFPALINGLASPALGILGVWLGLSLARAL